MDTSKILRYAWKGAGDKHWYEDCTKCLIGIFGADKLDLVTKLFAATSINTSLKANVTLFRKALHEIENDLPIGDYLPNIQNQLAKIRAGESLSGRKISAFAAAMSGDPNAVVVDIWVLRAFKMNRRYKRKVGDRKGLFREGGATDKQYTIIESYIREEAKHMGLEPRQLCAMIWAGTRVSQGKDTQTRYTHLLELHYKHNLFPSKQAI